MALFSERKGYTQKPLQFETMSQALKNRIWNVYSCEVCTDVCDYDSHYLEEILDYLGLPVEKVYDVSGVLSNLDKLKKWFDIAEWYMVYDFIEIYVALLPPEERFDAKRNFNYILQQENAGYRASDSHVIPITNEVELRCIEAAQETAYRSVNIHFQKATELYSKRPVPDYENTIKEAISAVEAMCCIIADNKKATLGDALKRLESKGIKLHKALQNAMSSLYGFTSDESGIRHGSIDFTGASIEDAKYMLITCSAFVNYLIEKWSKVQS